MTTRFLGLSGSSSPLPGYYLDEMACFRHGGTDDISQRMYALIGLGHSRVRERLNICHSQLLACAGILSGPGRTHFIGEPPQNPGVTIRIRG